MTKISTTLATAAAVAELLVRAAAADTYTVTSIADAVDATPGNGACATATGACTLRAAVQEANAHAGADAIALPAGIFLLSLLGPGEDAGATGDLDVIDPLTVTGAGREATILDGLGADRVLHAVGGSLTVRDLTIRHGSESTGGALFVNGAATTLERVRCKGNTATSAGGAVAQASGSLTTTDSVFEGNVAAGAQGGAIAATGPATLTLTNSVFEGNIAPGMGEGAAVRSSATGAAIITGCSFTGNFGDIGGSVYLQNASSTTISDSTFEANTATGPAGGPIAVGAGNVTLTNVRSIGNSSAQAAGGYFAASAGTIQIAGSEFSDNVATTNLGAFVAQAANGLVVTNTAVRRNTSFGQVGGFQAAVPPPGTATLTDVEVAENSAQQVGGFYVMADASLTGVRIVNNGASMDVGGAYVACATACTASQLTVDGNVAGGNLGGIYFAGPTVSLDASTISNNTAASPLSQGGGAFVATSTSGTITNTTFSGNVAGGQSGGLLTNGPSVTLRNATFVANSAPTGGSITNSGALSIVSTIISGAGPTACGGNPLTDGGNNIDSSGTCGLASALVVDPQLGPLADNGGPTLTHLPAPSSPAIDAGNPVGCPATDQRGQARPTDGNGDGSSRCDIGATEFLDLCPTDPAKTLPGLCGCGVADTDTDQPNGTADCLVNGELKARVARAKTIVTGLATDTDPLETELTAIGSSLAPYVKQFKGQIQLTTPKAKLDKLAKRAAKAVKKLVKAKAAKLDKARTKATTRLDTLDAAVAPQS